MQVETADLRSRLLEKEEELVKLKARLREREAAVASATAVSQPSSPSSPSGAGSHAAVHAADGAAGPEGRDQESLQELHEKLAAAGVQLPRRGRRQAWAVPDCSKPLEALHRDVQERLSQLMFEGGSVVRHEELVKVMLVADVDGKHRYLVERDCFDLTTGDQRVVMLPVRSKIQQGQTWREAMRTALTEVGLPHSWQDEHLKVDESSYRCQTLREAQSDFPQLPTVQRVHEVRACIDMTAKHEVSNSPLERIGLPDGHDFISRKVCPDGRTKLHVWCWESRPHEETALVKAFEQYLKAHGVDVSQFGMDAKKSLYQFYAEVKELKESSLEEMPDGTGDGGGVSLLRVSELLIVRLVAEVEKRSFILTSSEQFLDDGRRRKVKQLLVTKVREGENWHEAMPRAFVERLGVPEDVQTRCFRQVEGSEEYEEKLTWSKGYPLRTLYKVRTVTMSILDPDDPSLEAIGLPRGMDFVTREGQLGHNQRGRLHVWTWAPCNADHLERRGFVGTGYEGFCKTLQDAENLVAQMVEHPQIASLGLMAPLSQSLAKIQCCLDKAADMDSIMAEVDVVGMMREDEKADGSVSSVDLAEFISSNYTRRRRTTLLPEFGGGKSPVHYRSGGSCSDILGSAFSLEIDPERTLRCFKAIQENQQTWGLDLFALSEDCGGRLIQVFGEAKLCRLCSRTLRCEREDVQEFLDNTASLYNDNPYHNDIHAVQVCHTAAWLAEATGLVKRQSALERAGFLIAALCHDVKHFGRSNSFCIETQHVLALTYNDAAVLENMHAATCYSLLQGTACPGTHKGANLLAGLSRDEQSGLRSQIIEYILSTDMSEHFEVISKFRMRREAHDFAASNEPDRRFVARLCLKAGDISHAALPWDVHTQWSARVTQEFLDQGSEEQQLGLPVSPLCDRRTLPDLGKSQRGFLEFVCLPLFDELASYEVINWMATRAEQERISRAGTWPRCSSPELGEEASDAAAGCESTTQEVVRWKTTARRSSGGGSRLKRMSQLQHEATVEQSCVAQIRANARRWVEDADAVARVVAGLKPDCHDGQGVS